MAIQCDHPRPKLTLPGRTPPRQSWSVPSFLSDNPLEMRRQLLGALQGIYDELQTRFAGRNLVPLIEDTQLRPGQVVAGVGAGQTLNLIEPTRSESFDPITIVLTAVSEPVEVVRPDGSSVLLADAGLFEFFPDDDSSYQRPPGDGAAGGQAPPDTFFGNVQDVAAPAVFLGLADLGGVRLSFNPTTKQFDVDTSGLAPATRELTALSPITGGGDLTADRDFGFDQTVDLDNNARVMIRVGGGANVGPRRRINLIAGAGIGITAVDDAGDEEVDVTIENTDTGNAPEGEPYVVHSASSLSNARLTVSSTSVVGVFPAAGQIAFQRAALTGDVTAAQNSNVLTIPSNTVDNTRLADMGANTVKGNPTPGVGSPQDIAAGTSSVLRRVGSGNLSFGQIDTSHISGDLNQVARVRVRVNSGGTVGERRRINLIQGANVSISAVDDAGSEEVDVTIAAPNLVPTTRQINTSSPLQGGGSLAGNLNLSFDQGVALNNNARVAVTRNTGATISTRRRLNFIEGSGIAIAVADSGGGEEANITISAAGGATPSWADTLAVSNQSGSNSPVVNDGQGIVFGNSGTQPGGLLAARGSVATFGITANNAMQLSSGTTMNVNGGTSLSLNSSGGGTFMFSAAGTSISASSTISLSTTVGSVSLTPSATAGVQVNGGGFVNMVEGSGPGVVGSGRGAFWVQPVPEGGTRPMFTDELGVSSQIALL